MLLPIVDRRPHLWMGSFRSQGEGLEFEGKAGAVRVHSQGTQTPLPCRGKLSFGGKTVESVCMTGRMENR
jgi:hypothetical protein